MQSQILCGESEEAVTSQIAINLLLAMGLFASAMANYCLHRRMILLRKLIELTKKEMVRP